jgi:periplasmic protein CpxP/Spy
MTNTPKSKLYLIIIGILLVSNIGLLFLFLNKDDGRGRKREDRGEKMTTFLKTEIGFNATQLQQVDLLNKQHKEKMKADFDSIKINKQQQLKELGIKGFGDSAILQTVEKNATQQKIMDQQMLAHFAAVRKICTAEQLSKFDSLFYKVWERKKK